MLDVDLHDSPLNVAARNGDLTTVTNLISGGLTRGEVDLAVFWAASRRHSEIVDQLLVYGEKTGVEYTISLSYSIAQEYQKGASATAAIAVAFAELSKR